MPPLLYSYAYHVCFAALGSLARYVALQCAAPGCAYAAAPDEIAGYAALTPAVGWAWATALHGIARYVALLIEAMC